MNKTDDKFCPDCGRHLYYQTKVMYWCTECGASVHPDNVKTFEDVTTLRARYDGSLDIDNEQ